MDYQALADELIAGHPITGAYSADDATALGELKAQNRTRPLASLSGDEVFNATDNSEFIALTDHKQLLWVSFTSKDSIDPFSTTNVAFVDHVFGTSSTTKSNLATLRVVTASRAEELGLGDVVLGDIQNARAL